MEFVSFFAPGVGSRIRIYLLVPVQLTVERNTDNIKVVALSNNRIRVVGLFVR